MSVQIMLTDFISSITPKCFNLHLVKLFRAMLKYLFINGQWVLTTIGRVIEKARLLSRYSIKRADLPAQLHSDVSIGYEDFRLNAP